jgi:hypothetical protein
MKHAGAATLAELAPLLDELRRIDGLVERTPGAFYCRSKAYLHFHEDPEGPFADVKLDGTTFTRLRVATRAERAKLLALLRRAL